MRRRRPELVRFLTLGAVLVVTLVLAQTFGLVAGLDRILSDRRAGVSLHPPGGDIVLVDIDARSLGEIGVWPWPRRLHGELVEKAAAAGARRIAFDVDFSTRSLRPGDDETFAAALAAAPIETFLAAFTQVAGVGLTDRVTSMPTASLLAHTWPVAVNAPADQDVVVRRFPYAVTIGTERVTSLPALLAGRDGDGDFGIDYTIDRNGFTRVSYVDLLQGRVPRTVVEGKTLIVGATAIELHDFFPAPAGGGIYGVTILALATETLLQGREIAPWQPATLPLLIIAVVMSLVLLPRRSMPVALAICAGSAVMIEATAFAAHQMLHLDVATASAQLLLAVVAASVVEREFDVRRLMLWVRGIEIRNQEAMIDRLVDEGFDAVVVFDDAGRVRRINRQARDLLDLSIGSTLNAVPPVLADAVRGVVADPTQRDRRREVQLTIGGSADGRILDAGLAAFEVEGTEAVRSAWFVCATLRDVTERVRAQDRIRQLALHDQGTDLPNRNALDLQLEAFAEDAPTLILIGLDRFRSINERLGHRTGDRVLRAVAERLREVVGEGVWVGRAGADEFAVLTTGTPDGRADLVERLASALERPIELDQHRLSVTAGIGVATASATSPTSGLLARATAALRDAKAMGAATTVVYDARSETERLKRLAIEFGLAAALDEGQFEVFYQPQVALSDRRIVGVEALVRWTHPTEGPISPAVFIPVAEETGMIHRLGVLVLERACRDAMQWPRPITVAVNVSPVQLQAGTVAATVERILAETGLPPERLQLELTESTFVHDDDGLRDEFDALTARGITFALDDFGTGYSSLSHLTRFPISKIKIDRGFVADAADNPTSMAVLRSVMALAEGLGAHSIAEGIETEEQAALLAGLGCEDGQGWLFSRAVPNAALTEMLGGVPEPMALAG